MTRSRIVQVVLLLAAASTLGACAAGPNDAANAATQEVAGFWLGLWQGLISPITFLISLFNDNVNVYEVHNNGNWYNFGFMLGVSIIFSGSARSGGAASRSAGRSARQRRTPAPDQPPDEPPDQQHNQPDGKPDDAG